MMTSKKQCSYCNSKADVVEQDSFYSCAKCWLRSNNDRYTKEKEKHNGKMG